MAVPPEVDPSYVERQVVLVFVYKTVYTFTGNDAPRLASAQGHVGSLFNRIHA